MKENVKECKDFQGKKLCMLLDGVKEEEMGILSKVNGELKGYLDAHMDEYREYHMERDNDSYD